MSAYDEFEAGLKKLISTGNAFTIRYDFLVDADLEKICQVFEAVKANSDSINIQIEYIDDALAVIVSKTEV